MRQFRVQALGHRIEGHVGSFGTEWVFVNGVQVSRRLGIRFFPTHTFSLVDAEGGPHDAEVRFELVGGLFARFYSEMVLAIDGRVLIRVPSLRAASDGKCCRCAYALDGLPLDEYGGYRCPECEAWNPGLPFVD